MLFKILLNLNFLDARNIGETCRFKELLGNFMKAIQHLTEIKPKGSCI